MGQCRGVMLWMVEMLRNVKECYRNVYVLFCAVCARCVQCFLRGTHLTLQPSPPLPPPPLVLARAYHTLCRCYTSSPNSEGGLQNDPSAAGNYARVMDAITASGKEIVHNIKGIPGGGCPIEDARAVSNLRRCGDDIGDAFGAAVGEFKTCQPYQWYASCACLPACRATCLPVLFLVCLSCCLPFDLRARARVSLCVCLSD